MDGLGDKWWRDSGGWGGTTSVSSFASSVRVGCKHAPLPLGDGLVIHGGSAGSPSIKDADVYLALDGGKSHRCQPWRGVVGASFPITDGQAPKDVAEFREVVVWLVDAVRAGKKVHVGCGAGHGRTGLVLAAVVAAMKVSDDPIKYVRDNYCAKVVESKTQVDFLVEHFGVAPAQPSKSYAAPSIFVAPAAKPTGNAVRVASKIAHANAGKATRMERGQGPTTPSDFGGEGEVVLSTGPAVVLKSSMWGRVDNPTKIK